MRRIAVHPSAEMYGSDQMFLESVAAMPEPRLAVVPSHGPLTEALAKRGIPYEVVDFPILRKVELRTPLAALRFLARCVVAVPRLARWLRRQKADGVYISTVIAPVWIYAGRLATGYVQCHVHENQPGMSRLAAKALLFPLRSAHLVVANSFDTRRWITRSTSRATAARTRVVHNAINDPLPVEAGAWNARGEKHLVLVGRLSKLKGQDVAIRATALLRRRGYDVGLTLVGDCYPGYEHVVDELQALVGELGLDEHVSFEGFQNPFPYVARADVALAPSRVESFGLAAAEALMLERPLVASRVGGLTEIVTHGETGLLVPPDDPDALADAVAALLDDPEMGAAMGRRGREYVREHFSAEDYARRFRAALDLSE